VPLWVAIVTLGLAVVCLAAAIVMYTQRSDAVTSRDAARGQVVNLQGHVTDLNAAMDKQKATVHACRLGFQAQSYLHAFGRWPPTFGPRTPIHVTERCFGTAVPGGHWPAP
jgi:hypothetical protein